MIPSAGVRRSAPRHDGPGPIRASLDRIVLALGAVTIAAYGSTFYAFGVLLEPVHDDTGWSRSTIGSAYSLSLLLGAVGAALAGAVVDRWGGRLPLGAAALVGCPGLALAASADDAATFVLAWGGGAGVVSALATYHVTLVVLVRARGRPDARSYAAVTFLGGLASPIYLPLVALLVDQHGWRTAQVVLAATLAAILLTGAALVPAGTATPTSSADASPRPSSLHALRDALRRPAVRRVVAGVALASLAGTTLHAYQVPAMQAAGLSLGAASGLAALRGLASLPGRGLLAVVVARTGTSGALVGAYLTMAAGALLLAGVGISGVAPAYAVVTGVVFGSILPLQALVAADLFPPSRLGTLMGAQQSLNGGVAALGPVALGAAVDASGSFTALVAAVVALFVAAALLVRVGLRLAAADERAVP